MSEELKSRLKTGAWQVFYMALGALVTFALEPGTLELVKAEFPKWSWAMPLAVALVTQVSKHIHNRREEAKAPPPL